MTDNNLEQVEKLAARIVVLAQQAETAATSARAALSDEHLTDADQLTNTVKQCDVHMRTHLRNMELALGHAQENIYQRRNNGG